jgi:septum formation protein
VVESKGKILRKANSADEAREILSAQSSSVVSIITCMIFQSLKLKLIDISLTKYWFGEFEKDDMDEYLKSNEWQGKAGACMVEGFCKKYIKKVQGLESNAKGLAIEKLKPFLDS